MLSMRTWVSPAKAIAKSRFLISSSSRVFAIRAIERPVQIVAIVSAKSPFPLPGVFASMRMRGNCPAKACLAK